MRDIKFRAWNKDYKLMDDCFFIQSNGVIYEPANKTYDTPNTEIEEKTQLIIMQYTGLKDKNGVEIYEGDILNFDWRLQATNELYADDCKNIKGLVLFENAKFIVRYFNKSMSFDLSDVNQNTFERFWRETYVSAKDDYFKMTDFEVIGNIHQNPELIK
jgi:uncharacterized phage protein (TIGR01671 family)